MWTIDQILAWHYWLLAASRCSGAPTPFLKVLSCWQQTRQQDPIKDFSAPNNLVPSLKYITSRGAYFSGKLSLFNRISLTRNHGRAQKCVFDALSRLILGAISL